MYSKGMESHLAAAKKELEETHNRETQLSYDYAEAKVTVTNQQAKVDTLNSKVERAANQLKYLVSFADDLENQRNEAKDVREMAERNYNMLKKQYDEQTTVERLRAENDQLRTENERLLATAARNRDIRVHAHVRRFPERR